MKTIEEAQQLSEIEIAIDAYFVSIEVTHKCVAGGASIERDGWKCDAWSFILTTPRGREQFDYYTGLGHRVKDHPRAPHIIGLIDSILVDMSACSMSFNEWCSDWGYDNDSRKAHSIYLACQENAEKFKRLFTSGQIEKLQELLQDY